MNKNDGTLLLNIQLYEVGKGLYILMLEMDSTDKHKLAVALGEAIEKGIAQGSERTKEQILNLFSVLVSVTESIKLHNPKVAASVRRSVFEQTRQWKEEDEKNKGGQHGNNS